MDRWKEVEKDTSTEDEINRLDNFPDFSEMESESDCKICPFFGLDEDCDCSFDFNDWSDMLIGGK